MIHYIKKKNVNINVTFREFQLFTENFIKKCTLSKH